MRLLGKIILSITLVILLPACENKDSGAGELNDFIPENAAVVLKVANLKTLFKDVRQNDALAVFSSDETFKYLSGESIILQMFQPSNPGLLSFIKRNDSITDYAFVTKQDSLVFQIDSLKNKISETLSYNSFIIDRTTIEGETVFTSIKDSMFIASSSQAIIEALLSDRKEVDQNLLKVMKIVGDRELAIITQSPGLIIKDSIAITLADQLALNVTIAPNGLTAAGVTSKSDTLATLINVFKGQQPQQNALKKIIPNEADEVIQFSFNNVELLVLNLAGHRGDSTKQRPHEIFDTATGIASISMDDGDAVIINSLDPTTTFDALRPYLSENSTYRDVTVFDFTQSDLFEQHFNPLIGHQNLYFAFQIDEFTGFASSMMTVEKLITAYKINDVLGNAGHFKNSTQYLAEASSLMIIDMNKSASNGVANLIFPNSRLVADYPPAKNFPLSIMQFSYDRDFAHVNYVCMEQLQSKKITGRVSQIFSKTLDQQILNEPKFFSNHRTGGKDIVLQDMSNTLKLFSSNGNLLWSKKLEGPIIGDVHEIDILRNKKKQLIFATKNKLHVLDRNGKAVAPFPINFKDDITQPLAVFDYDNNRKYRFAIVQGKEVLLYDSNGKVVSGFKFKGATSNIIHPAQHFRLNKKDFIVVAEENGKLHILSRVGKTRIPVSKKFEFSDAPVTSEGLGFVVITSDKEKITISQSGTISSQKLNVSENYEFVSKLKTKVTLDDNLLRINGKLVELPFGIYTAPEIFRVNGNTYITITETQEKKVHVYDVNGEMVQGFPVYGSSKAVLADAMLNGRMNLLVKGTDSELILYQLR